MHRIGIVFNVIHKNVFLQIIFFFTKFIFVKNLLKNLCSREISSQKIRYRSTCCIAFVQKIEKHIIFPEAYPERYL